MFENDIFDCPMLFLLEDCCEDREKERGAFK